MKKELLAPAGDMECLKSAIHNGCDAIYLAGKSFGARKFAKNFTNEELEEALKYAHLFGVKIYVTVNTIIYESEIEECLNYLGFLYNIGVDAVIVQDIGLIKLIREYLPDLEIHASTQAHTHNIEQIKMLENMGVKRVVLAREMSISEINELDTSMDLEIFIHGALCISYSGQCLLSSGVLNRSGNRGECAGLCRIPYNLLEEDKTILKDKFLLSPKEFNTTNYVHELKKTRVLSFKIEGRMKSPEYVGYVTRIYRKLLDNDNYSLSEEEIFNLKSLYNRGFTKGYLFHNSDKEFISLNSSNHLGVIIGEVIEVSPKKIKIRLSHELNQEDAIRLPNNKGMYVNFLYNEDMMLVSNASKNSIVYVDNKVDLDCLGAVMLTINKRLVNDVLNTPLKTISVNVYVKAKKNEALEIRYSDLENEVYYKGEVVESAKSMPISKDRIREIVSKLGNTPFRASKVELDVSDDVFIPVGKLNEIRRKLVSELIDKRTSVNRCVKVDYKRIGTKATNVNKVYISVAVESEEQLKVALSLGVSYIYVRDRELYKKYKSSNVYLRLKRVNNSYNNYNNENLVVGETGSLIYTKNNMVVSDYFLNVVNSAYVQVLDSMGVRCVTLSPELRDNQIKEMLEHFDGKCDIEVLVYGRVEYMIMKYNLNQNMNLDKDKKYYLEDKSRRKFRVYNDGYTHLLSDRVINNILNVDNLRKVGVNTFRLEFSDEDGLEVRRIIEMVKKCI